ncbi:MULTISPECIES: DUF4907 domain-containing protein [unclassified Chitinophaga]|uniref:DUF4907 domain-containing protein n=1 Tax=unclassified Chitinophaga TaxID=2619133 RepID=UPI0030101379
MTKRNIIIIAGIAVIVLAFVVGKSYRKTTPGPGSDMVPVVVVPFEINNGWGYRVNVDGHTYIYQDVIPAIPGNHVFRSREEAMRVGQVVAAKLTQHKIPSVSRQELIAMQIPEAQ